MQEDIAQELVREILLSLTEEEFIAAMEDVFRLSKLEKTSPLLSI